MFKAFDCLKPPVAARALRQIGVHPTVRGAWLKENEALDFRPKLLSEDINLCQILTFHALRQLRSDR